MQRNIFIVEFRESKDYDFLFKLISLEKKKEMKKKKKSK